MRRMLSVLAALVLAGSAYSHCQVPCGIYGDDGRFTTMNEHATTIEKAMNQIQELSKGGETNYNQLVRWVTNKESHAQEIQDMAQSYFLAQRIKFPASSKDKGKYYRKLEHLHRIIVFAMKCKQTTDLANVESLRKEIHDFAHLYNGK